MAMTAAASGAEAVFVKERVVPLLPFLSGSAPAPL